jgi:hypothetical protein
MTEKTKSQRLSLEIFKSKAQIEKTALDKIVGGTMAGCHIKPGTMLPTTPGSCDPTCTSHHCIAN